MSKWKVTVRGIGKIGNNVKNIDETFEIEDAVMNDLRNTSTTAKTLEGLLLTRCPGVTVEANKLGLNIEEITEPIIKKEKVKEISTAFIAGAVGGAIVDKKSNRKTNTKEKEPIETTAPLGIRLRMISNFVWKDDLENTIEKLKYISLETTGHKWVINPKNNVEKENNRTLSKCYKQYKTGFKHYKNLVEYKELKRNLKRFRLKLLFSKYILLTVPAIIILLIFLIVFIDELSSNF